MMNIEYCIDLFPTVNTSVDIYHNWIILHLFSMVAANSMTVITGLLDLLSLSEKITKDEIREWHVIQLYFSMIIDEYWRKMNG